ncbi:MAG: DUF5930 domain-containing protein [Rhodobacter sp.]|nr:DUF5930 domain-containing protein [Rhodobacter sp.]
MLRSMNWMNSRLERTFPKLRIFLRFDSHTRFISLSPLTQAAGWTGCALLAGWTVIASAVALTNTITSGNLRDQIARDRQIYEEGIGALRGERDLSLAEAREAQERLNVAWERISAIHSAFLESEDRRRELEKGMETMQAALRHTANWSGSPPVPATEVDAFRGAAVGDSWALDAEAVSFLASALKHVADDRDALNVEAAEARRAADTARHDIRLLQQKNDRIFSRLEEAITISMEPLDSVFGAVGLSSESVLDTVRQGYSGQGGPLTPTGFADHTPLGDPETVRSLGILAGLDDLNLSRLALVKIPLSMPVKGNYRVTSRFGPRWGRMHKGLDLAAEYGTPILATADGIVTFAGWLGDYGRIVKIRHEFGLETYYAHLAKIRVNKGQRVSHGDRIGDMGTSGRSTGTHLHYEVRANGKAINPMIYIKASNNVF